MSTGSQVASSIPAIDLATAIFAVVVTRPAGWDDVPMPDIAIRRAETGDVEAARDVLRAAYAQYQKAFPPENWLPYLADILDLEGRAHASDLLVAEREAAVVACVSYYRPGAEMSYPSESFSEQWPSGWAAIRLLAVAPGARGSGFGRMLTEACIERARNDGARGIGLHTTTQMSVARAMYERMGFSRAPQYDFQPSPSILVEAYQLVL